MVLCEALPATEPNDLNIACDRFVGRIVVHHQAGDYYPDPWVISDELGFTYPETEDVMSRLRALRWIAASPYGPERLRLTPRCWNALRRGEALSAGGRQAA